MKLRVTFERKQKYYSTRFSLTENEFFWIWKGKRLIVSKGDFKRLNDEERETKIHLQADEAKAVQIIKSLPLFSWKKFEDEYLTNRIKKDTIDQAFKEYSIELRSQGRIGTAISYECAGTSLSNFRANTKFTDVAVDFLRSYETWMLSNKKSITTVGIYLRSLRTIFNNAIAAGDLQKDFYPFGKRKYEIPTGENKKKALTLADIALIYNYNPLPGSYAEMARDYWLFSYLSFGMNIKDISLLKFKNIKGNSMEFLRAKTIRTKRKVESIRVPITDDILAIIKKHGNAEALPDNYIFPILSHGITAERTYQLIQQITGLVNDHMKRIAKELKIEGIATTMAARHSFSTVLKRSGISTEFISEALGHSNVNTTQNYLAGFEDDKHLEAAKALTAFRKASEEDK